jgi:magnesium transporter
MAKGSKAKRKLRAKAQSRKKTGALPGSLIHIGERRLDHAKVTLMEYNPEEASRSEFNVDGPFCRLRSVVGTTWINIDGLHDVRFFEEIGENYGIHPLVLEDCLNTRQRPKLDDYTSYLFVVMRLLTLTNPIGTSLLTGLPPEIEDEQISFILGKDFLVSPKESDGKQLDIIRDRVAMGTGKIRREGADFLLYSLVDAVVDDYFLVSDELSEAIEVLEAEVLAEPTPSTLQKIYEYKHCANFIRKNVIPLREVMGNLAKGNSELVRESSEPYFQDVYDHVLQVIEAIDVSREMLSGLMDLYHTAVSNRTNETMRVLTVLASIFIPITFVAGVYGMNFDHMPELHWRYGYLFVWGLMFAITVGLLAVFKRRSWI